MRSIPFAIAALLMAAPMSAEEKPVLPAWMAGCWMQEEGDRWTEECWTAPRAGIMLGSGRNGVGEKLGSWEVMQIALDRGEGEGHAAGMAFWGAPGANDRTMFTWQPSADQGVTFVNAAHDYPQRIRYWREGERLMAEVSLVDGSNANRWSYRRAY